MTRFLILFCFILINSFSYSQHCILRGRLIDKESQEPLPYGNAILTSSKDTVFFEGAISDEKGVFIVNGLRAGIYNLKMSFMGYQSVQINSILLQRGSRDIGDVVLNILAEDLEAVTIKATKQAIRYKVDKKVIDAGSFPGANVAMDLLENIPSLQVDFEGNLSYRGDGTFQVFINGHPVSNGAEKLKQISADKIDKIEVITNPSAKYGAEGTAGIIQVILKRNRLQGFAINSSARVTSLGSYEWLFSVDKVGESGGWYVDGQLAKYVWNKTEYSEYQVIKQEDRVYKTQSTLKNEQGGVQNYIEFGFNYDLTDKDFIDFSLNVNPLKCTNDNSSAGFISDLEYLSANLIKEKNYYLNNSFDLFYRYLGATFTYNHAFNKDRSHLLSTYFDYSTYLHPLEEMQIDNKKYEINTERLGFKGKEFNEMFFEVKIDYQNKLSELSSFEAGAEVNLDHIPKVTSVSGIYDEYNIITPFPNEPLDQEVDFIQDIYSGYLTFKSGFKEFEYQLGLRTEFTFRKSNYSYNDLSEFRKLIPSEEQFINIFPSIHAVYNFSETHQLAANFSRRVKRPDYWSLIPLSQYSTPYIYYKGNGCLMPAYSSNFEIGYKKSWDKNFIGSELFARNTQNVIQSYLRTDTANIMIETPENVGESWSIGAEFMTGIDIFPWWNINMSTSLFSYKLFVDIDTLRKTDSQLRSDSRVNNTFLLPMNFTFKVDFNYKSPEITAQAKRDGYFYSNIAIKKSFKDNLWELSFSYLNVFNSMKFKKLSGNSVFYIKSDYVIQPAFLFKVAYSFDNQE